MGKKQRVISRLFEICRQRGDLTFDNALVKSVCREVGFGNAFDATKVDSLTILPDDVRQAGYFIVHLGQGRHRFVRGIGIGYHSFEPIDETERILWKYRRSLLNELDTSESNILSVASNQRVLHDFLYDDIVASPKAYNARRTKQRFGYWIGSERIEAVNLQMEIDFTFEYQGVVTVMEGKNGFPPNFAVYQLFHPFRYYVEIDQEYGLGIRGITGCYILRRRVGKISVLRLYNYTFEDPEQMASIRLLKKAEYHLVHRG